MRYNSTEFVWLDVAIRTFKEDCDWTTNTTTHSEMYNILINNDNNFLWRGGVLRGWQRLNTQISTIYNDRLGSPVGHFLPKYCPKTARKWGETAQILPWNYYQILLKKGVVSKRDDTAQALPRCSTRHILPKLSKLPWPPVEVKILSIIFCFHCPEMKKDKTEVLSLI